MQDSSQEIYLIKTEDLIGANYDSYKINLFMEFIDEAKDLILSPTDDMERWKHSNKLALTKLAEEFKYYSLFEGTKGLEILQTTPEIIWGLSRIRDTYFGVEYFFKIMGVKDIHDKLQGRNVEYFANKSDLYEAKQNNTPCKSSLELTEYVESGQDYVKALSVYAIAKKSICEDLRLFYNFATDIDVISEGAYSKQHPTFCNSRVEALIAPIYVAPEGAVAIKKYAFHNPDILVPNYIWIMSNDNFALTSNDDFIIATNIYRDYGCIITSNDDFILTSNDDFIILSKK